MLLELLVTDTWVRPKNPIGYLRPGLRTRFHSDLGSADVKASATSSLAFELRARAAGLRGWQQIMARNEWFQALATKRLSRLESRAARRTVMAYSYAAREILRLARDRGWRTVLGQIDPGPAEDRIVARLYRKSQSYADAFERPPAEYWARWREECDIADRVVVNSAWSRAALIDEGVPAGKIRIVPLAYEERRLVTPFERAYPAAFSPSRPLRVLFLGQINLRKGIELLLELDQDVGSRTDRVHVCGANPALHSTASARASKRSMDRKYSSWQYKTILPRCRCLCLTDLLGWLRHHSTRSAGLEGSGRGFEVLRRGRH